MMRKWMTVVSWQRGIATLSCEQHSGCSGCRNISVCGTHILNQLAGGATHQLQVLVAQPLMPGQYIEIGLVEASLLRLALLVYMTPLLGLILGGGFFQWLLATDIGALCGGVCGGFAGFSAVKFYAEHLYKNSAYHPVVLQIALRSSTLPCQEDDE